MPKDRTQGALQGTLISHKPLADMTPQEVRVCLQHLKERLQQKQQRERAYLDRRKKRGVHTPTDDAYEQDQALENELLALLEELLQRAEEMSADE